MHQRGVSKVFWVFVLVLCAPVVVVALCTGPWWALLVIPGFVLLHACVSLVAGIPLAAMGVGLMLWDKVRRGRREPATREREPSGEKRHGTQR